MSRVFEMKEFTVYAVVLLWKGFLNSKTIFIAVVTLQALPTTLGESHCIVIWYINTIFVCVIYFLCNVGYMYMYRIYRNFFVYSARKIMALYYRPRFFFQDYKLKIGGSTYTRRTQNRPKIQVHWNSFITWSCLESPIILYSNFFLFLWVFLSYVRRFLNCYCTLLTLSITTT